MFVSFMQKSRLAHMEAVVRAAEDAASDRASVHQMTFAIQVSKSNSCLASGRPIAEDEKKTAVQLAKAVTPDEADRIALLLLSHAGDLKQRGQAGREK